MIMNKLDLEMKLLNGSELYLGQIPIYKLTLKQMTDFGYSKSQMLLNVLTLKDEDTKKFFKEDVECSTYKLIYYSFIDEISKIGDKSLTDKDFENSLFLYLLSFLELLFRSKVDFDIEYGFIIENQNNNDGNKYFYLNENNFNDFREILRYRNCLDDKEGDVDSDNPSNEMARMLLEKRKKLREKLKKAKQNNDEDSDNPLTIADLISIFAEAQHMPPQDVYEKYDIYQFNNQFNRLKIMDDYQVNIRFLLAGAKSEDVNLQHWLTKIKKQDE